MPDDDAPRASRRSAKAGQAGRADHAAGAYHAADDEAAAELSRAAREAVRQPPDPRLEASFAKLGLWSDPHAPAAAEEPATRLRAAAAAPLPDEHEDLRAALTELRLATEGLRRRLDLAVRLEAVVVVLLGILVVLVLVRQGS